MAVKVYLENLGCAKNQVDAEWILARLARGGAEIVRRPEEADAILVNTCSFIEAAREESVETILELAELKKRGKGKKLFVTGCLAQRYREELRKALPEADAVVETVEPLETAQCVARELGLTVPGSPVWYAERWRLNPRHFAYLKLAEGCDNRCTFCAIPLIKGRFRSRPLSEVLAEASSLVAKGAKELLLVAQDTTYYGRDVGHPEWLVDLLDGLGEIDGLEWIRVLYTYPRYLTDALVKAMAENPKVCRYIDLPVQHGSDAVLRRMGRGTPVESLKRWIEKLRQRIPELVIRSTVLVGFPGETEAEFQALLDFLDWAQFERLGVFGFSPEEGTRAWTLPGRVPEETIRERVNEVMRLHEKNASEWGQNQVGRRLRVLVDGRDQESGLWVARTEWDAPEIDHVVWLDEPVQEGCFVEVEIEEALPYELFGTPAPAEKLEPVVA